MKILVCSVNFPPDLIGIAKYTGEMCQWLSDRGHEVRVITAPPYYPDWKVPPAYRNLTYSAERVGDIQVTRCPLYVPRLPTGFRRILHHLSFAISSSLATFAVTAQFRPDVVLTVAPSILASPAALLAARASGARAWLHVQDLEIDAAFGLGFLSGNRLRRFALWLEGGLLRRFCRVSSISRRMMERIAAKGVEASRLIEFRNWVDAMPGIVRSNEMSYRATLGIPQDATMLLYSGNMAVKQGLEYLVMAARRLQELRPDVVFVLCGSGPMRHRLVEEAKGLRNVRFLELQSPERIPHLLGAADIHLLPQRAAASDCVLPSKLGGMLASGRPVIAMAANGTQLAAEVEGAGLAVPPGDVPAFVDAILLLAADARLRHQLGAEAGRVAATRWDKQATLERFEQELFKFGSSRRLGTAFGELSAGRAIEKEVNTAL